MEKVIRVAKRGSFHIGGEKTRLEHIPVEDIPYNDGKFVFHSDPNGMHWTKQMYVQYTMLAQPKAPYPMLLWHGGGLTGVTWETTPDGREGWDNLFLRAGYDVYVSDAVERGRAGWAKFPEINPVPPVFHSYESRWLNLKLGVHYPEPYEGSRFPVAHYNNLMMQSVPRWLSSDEWTANAYIAYLEKMQGLVDGVILMAHSQGCIYAMHAARIFPDFVKALILIEPIVFPGPEEEYSNLKKIPQLYVYGDFMSAEYTPVHSWVQSVRETSPVWRTYLEQTGVDYTWLSLPEQGVKGNSHMLMMDNNSDEIAAMIAQWLDKKGLATNKNAI